MPHSSAVPASRMYSMRSGNALLTDITVRIPLCGRYSPLTVMIMFVSVCMTAVSVSAQPRKSNSSSVRYGTKKTGAVCTRKKTGRNVTSMFRFSRNPTGHFMTARPMTTVWITGQRQQPCSRPSVTLLPNRKLFSTATAIRYGTISILSFSPMAQTPTMIIRKTVSITSMSVSIFPAL